MEGFRKEQKLPSVYSSVKVLLLVTFKECWLIIVMVLFTFKVFIALFGGNARDRVNGHQ